MHPADEYAKLKEEIGRLTDRAQRLRDRFLGGQAPLRSNSHEVVVTRHPQKVFVKELLPHDILSDPRYWRDSETAVVRVKSARGDGGSVPLAACAEAPRPFAPRKDGGQGHAS